MLSDQYALAYVDPPFFTQRDQISTNRAGTDRYEFQDTWQDFAAYKYFLSCRLSVIRDCLFEDGSIIVHCDRNASHYIRCLLDEIFGIDNFRSEIIWTYRRWSNSQRGLTPAHQTLFWYSTSSKYRFNVEYGKYSPTTNIDQILQRRARDARNKSVYARNLAGDAVYGVDKKGVPLSDVWDIPFLNPKARERVGYPTQKPVELLLRLIRMLTNEGDAVLDPFCGSGTALVAAKELGRTYTGIDLSQAAVSIALNRLENPIITRSIVSSLGRDAFDVQEEFVANVMAGLSYMPVQRNSGIDGIIPANEMGFLTFLRVQRPHETLVHAVRKLKSAARSKGTSHLVVIQTHLDLLDEVIDDLDITIIKSVEMAISSQTFVKKRSAA